MPSKHSKNNTAGPVFTYAERKKLKWGTQKVRVGRDSMRDFDACCICLHQAVDPLVCHKGHIFCKGCIYESLLTQKKFIKEQMARYEQQEQEKDDSTAQAELDKKVKQLEQFDQMETGILPSRANTADKAALPGYKKMKTESGKSVYVVDRDLVSSHSIVDRKLTKEEKQARAKYMPSFWLPHMTPDEGIKRIKKPKQHTCCPEGNHTLRLKQLRPLRFTLRPGAEVSGTPADKAKNKGRDVNNASHMTGRFMCPSCRKTLTNCIQSVCIRKCGHVLCQTCIDTLVKKDRQCIECGQSVKSDKDLIPIQRGGTGFAKHGAREVKSLVTPVFQCG